MTTLLITMFLIAVYIAPTATAYQRKTKNKVQVLMVNLLLGWTFIGWFVALIMAYSPNKE